MRRSAGTRARMLGARAVATKRPSGASTATRAPKTQADPVSNGANSNTDTAKVSTSTAMMPAIGPSTGFEAPVPTR
jgi:hypothetical protein